MADGERDLTPYDLADRLVAGLEVTDVGKREIAAELIELRRMIQRPPGHRLTLAEWFAIERRVSGL